jgi:hypothetical protein
MTRSSKAEISAACKQASCWASPIAANLDEQPDDQPSRRWRRRARKSATDPGRGSSLQCVGSWADGERGRCNVGPSRQCVGATRVSRSHGRGGRHQKAAHGPNRRGARRNRRSPMAGHARRRAESSSPPMQESARPFRLRGVARHSVACTVPFGNVARPRSALLGKLGCGR